MYEADDLQAINLRQLATATDRLLVLGARRQHRTGATSDLARGSFAQFAGIVYDDFDKTIRDPRPPEHVRAHAKTELVRAQSSWWTNIQRPLLIATLILAIILVLVAASTIVGNAAAVAVGLSGAFGGLIGGGFVYWEARRARF